MGKWNEQGPKDPKIKETEPLGGLLQTGIIQVISYKWLRQKADRL